MLWHDLHMDCDMGSCDVTPEATQPQAQPATAGPTPSTRDMGLLHQVLSKMSRSDLAMFASTLSPLRERKNSSYCWFRQDNKLHIPCQVRL